MESPFGFSFVHSKQWDFDHMTCCMSLSRKNTHNSNKQNILMKWDEFHSFECFCLRIKSHRILCECFNTIMMSKYSNLLFKTVTRIYLHKSIIFQAQKDNSDPLSDDNIPNAYFRFFFAKNQIEIKGLKQY